MGAEAVKGGLSGLLSGAAQGAAKQAADLSRSARLFLNLGARALNVAAEATTQILSNDERRITSYASLLGAALAPVGSAAKKPSTASGSVLAISDLADSLRLTVKFGTPWADLAQAAIQKGTRPTTEDWITARGASLIAAADVFEPEFALGRKNHARILNAVTAGALLAVDEEAGLQFLAKKVGKEVGTLIGEAIADPIDSALKGLAADYEKDRQRKRTAAVVGQATPEPARVRVTASQQQTFASDAPRHLDPEKAELLDFLNRVEAGLVDPDAELAKLLGPEAQEAAVLGQAESVVFGDGDTLSKLATRALGTNASRAERFEWIAQVMTYNGIQSANRIPKDTLIWLPASGTVEASEEARENLRRDIREIDSVRATAAVVAHALRKARRGFRRGSIRLKSAGGDLKGSNYWRTRLTRSRAHTSSR